MVTGTRQAAGRQAARGRRASTSPSRSRYFGAARPAALPARPDRQRQRPAALRLVARLVAARGAARAEPVRHARALGAARKQPRLDDVGARARAAARAGHARRRAGRRLQHRRRSCCRRSPRGRRSCSAGTSRGRSGPRSPAATSSASRATCSAQELGHLHMTSVFLVPLAALVVLRFLEGELGARGLVAPARAAPRAPARVLDRGLLHAHALPRGRARARARSSCRRARQRLGARRSCRSPAPTASAPCSSSPLLYYALDRLPGRDHAGHAQPGRPRHLRVPDRADGDRRQPRAALRPVGRRPSRPRTGSTSGCRCSRSSCCSRSRALAPAGKPVPRARARASRSLATLGSELRVRDHDALPAPVAARARRCRSSTT